MTRKRLQLSAALVGFTSLLALLFVACNDSDAADNGGVSIATLTPGSVSTPSVASILRDFTFPIVKGCLPEGDQLMPNAPRIYRDGVHEGVDFYDVDNCTDIQEGTPVVAVKAGRVIRVDLDYRDLTLAESNRLLAAPNSPEALDRFRGRQVWIDHGGGVVTRSCHLSAIASGIAVGSLVSAGQIVGYVGESGTPESLTDPGSELHLHFEVRIGDTFLGSGLPPSEVRTLYQELFSR